jgi:hypothetical protein
VGVKNCFLTLLTAWMVLTGLVVPAQTASDYDVLVQKGKTQLQAGSFDMALGTAEAATQLAPKRWEAYAVFGAALVEMKRYDEAVDKLSQAILLAPEAKQAGLRDLRRQCMLKQASAVPPTETATSASQAEIVLWKTVEESNDPAQLYTYLQQYPNGAFAPVARARIAQQNEREARKAAFGDSVRGLLEGLNAAGQARRPTGKMAVDEKYQLRPAAYCQLQYKEVSTYKTDKDTWGATIGSVVSYGLHNAKEINAIVFQGQLDMAAVDPASIRLYENGNITFKGRNGRPVMNGVEASVDGIGKTPTLSVSGECSENRQARKCEFKAWRPEVYVFRIGDFEKGKQMAEQFTNIVKACGADAAAPIAGSK